MCYFQEISEFLSNCTRLSLLFLLYHFDENLGFFTLQAVRGGGEIMQNLSLTRAHCTLSGNGTVRPRQHDTSSYETALYPPEKFARKNL